MAKSKQEAPKRRMVPHDKPPRRTKILGGKPWVFEADHLFVHDVQTQMGRSLLDVFRELSESNEAPPMPLVYELGYHLTAAYRDDLFEQRQEEVSFRRFLRLLGVASVKAQSDFLQFIMGLIWEALQGESPAAEEADEGNAEEPAPTAETAG